MNQPDRGRVLGYCRHRTGLKALLSRMAPVVLAAWVVSMAHAADGYYDPSFGQGGRVSFDASNGAVDYASAMQLLPDGRILMAGSCKATDAAALFKGCAVRLNRDGSYSNGFGPSGIGSVRFDAFSGLPDEHSISAMLRLPDGRLVFAGRDGAGYGLIVVLNANGQALDTNSFGGAGFYRFHFGGASSGLSALALQPDGKLLAAGYGWDGQQGGGLDMAVARFRADLIGLDDAFGSNGLKLVAFDLGGPAEQNHDYASAVCVQADGRILLAGRAELGSSSMPRAALARLTANGQLDTSFGPNADGRAHLGGVQDSDFVDMAIDARGRIIAGGAIRENASGANTHWMMTRFLASGALDPGFNAGAPRSFEIFDGGWLYALLVRPHGDILATGSFDKEDGTRNFGVLRVRANGSLDASFGNGGIAIGIFTQSIGVLGDSYGDAIALGNGGLMIGGDGAASSTDKTRFGVAKLRFDPIFDDGFENLP